MTCFSVHTEQGGETPRARMRLGRSSHVPVPPCHSQHESVDIFRQRFFPSNHLGDEGQTVPLKACLGIEWMKLVVLEKKEKKSLLEVPTL